MPRKARRAPRKARGATRREQLLVSVCMIAKDEERFLAKALRSVQGLADEIILVDTGSTDRTIEIAQSFEARVYEIPWPNDFATARNHSLEKARGRWILVLDADEEFPPDQPAFLRHTLETAPSDVVGFQISQANVASVTDHRLIDAGKTVRIFRNHPTHRYVSPIHEQILPSLRDHGKIGNTPFYVWHYGFLQDVVASKQKIERNRSMLLKFMDEIDPDDMFRNYVLMQLGRESQRLLRPDEADGYYARALEGIRHAPDNHPFFMALSAYYMENLVTMGRHGEVKAFAPQALERFPWSAELWFFLGVAELNLDEHALGVTHLLWSTTLGDVKRSEQEFYSPGRAVAAWGNATRALIDLGAPEAALTLCIAGLREPPEEPALATTTYGLLLGRPDLQVLFAQKASACALGQILKIAALRDDDTTVQQVGSTALHEHPQDPTVRFWIAALALRRRDYVLAKALFEQVPATGDVGGYARLGLVAAWAALGEQDRLHALLDKAPRDLFHTLQREIAGHDLGDLPRGYAEYRAGLMDLMQLWHLLQEGDTANDEQPNAAP